MKPSIERDLKGRQEALVTRLSELGSLVVAFSGGVDSSFLLAVAAQVLGDRVLAVTAVSVIHPEREKQEAVRFTSERGIEHILLPSREMELPEFVSNNPDRCYHCKRSILDQVSGIARERGIPHVAHAANADDHLDYRPGGRGRRPRPAHRSRPEKGGNPNTLQRDGAILLGQTFHGLPGLQNPLRGEHHR